MAESWLAKVNNGERATLSVLMPAAEVQVAPVALLAATTGVVPPRTPVRAKESWRITGLCRAIVTVTAPLAAPVLANA